MKTLWENFIQFSRERDLLPKLVSLLLAVLLWVFIDTINTGRRKYRVPLEMKNLPAHLTISRISHRYMTLTFEGDNEVLENINVKSVRAYVDFRNPVLGTPKKYEVELVSKQIPESIRVKPSIDYVTATVDEAFEKWIRVTPEITGNPRGGAVVGRVRVAPEFVQAKGARSLIENLENIKTEEISIDNQADNVVQQVDIVQNGLENVTFNESSVKVIVPIAMRDNLESLDLKVTVINRNEAFDYDLEKERVSVYLKEEDRKKTGSGEFDAYINVGGLNPAALLGNRDSFKIEMPVIVRSKTNNNLDIISVLPDKIVVIIQK